MPFFLHEYDKIDIDAPVAQRIEQYRPKVTVEGSIPFWSAILLYEGARTDKNRR